MVCLLLKKYTAIHILAFLDRAALPGQIFSGVPVYKPEFIKINLQDKNSLYVIVAIHNPISPVNEITDYLKLLGYKRFISMVDFYNQFPDNLESSYWLTKSSVYLTYKNELLKCSELWEDTKSKLLFNALLHHRLFGDYSILPKSARGHQYFPQYLSNWDKLLRLVDCGAYDGDTLRQAQELDISIECLYAFEPDGQNFKNLSKFLHEQKHFNYKVAQQGVYSSSREIGFISEGSEASKITESNNNLIPVVSLDDILGDFSPNYIKMVIEGAEFEALIGAKNTIFRYRPGLAICLYHHPEHLWKIPLMIDQWELNYKLYIRSHSYNGFDVVMYAFAD